MSALELAIPKGLLPECSPNLMPFHIEYSGPAPISTYFRVKPVPSRTPGTPHLEPPTEGAGEDKAGVTAEVAASASGVAMEGEGGSSEVTVARVSEVAVHTQNANDDNIVDENPTSPLGARVKNASARFVAAFRGRTVHGLKVDMPEGYTGVVLRGKEGSGYQEKAEAEKKGKGKGKTRPSSSKAMPQGRATRSQAHKRAEMDIIEVDDQHDVNGRLREGEGGAEAHVRALQPTATFSSFVVWHPDIPVDESRDEYMRSLTEWTQLAAEIHRVEDSDEG